MDDWITDYCTSQAPEDRQIQTKQNRESEISLGAYSQEDTQQYNDNYCLSKDSGAASPI